VAGHLSCVKLLMDNGADVNSRDDWCYNPPEYYPKCGHGFSLVFATFVIPCPCSQCCPLHLSSEKGLLEVSRFLVENKADVNSRDKRCDPPLNIIQNVDMASALCLQPL
jgi:ankyrin repeat protein